MADLTTSEARALDAIKTTSDVEKLRAFAENAKRLGSDRVENAAFSRLCEVTPKAKPGTIEHDVWRSITALEEMLRSERGKTTLLSRTRQKISRDGEVKTAADLTLKPDASKGFHDLLDRGFPELTFECVVLRHHEKFDNNVLDAARQRLADVGLTPEVSRILER